MMLLSSACHSNAPRRAIINVPVRRAPWSLLGMTASSQALVVWSEASALSAECNVITFKREERESQKPDSHAASLADVPGAL